MTGRPERRDTTAIAPPAPQGLALHHGTLQTGWCAACKAWTRITADLLLLAPDGLSTIGTLSYCEVCEDPDHPLPARRIDHAGP